MKPVQITDGIFSVTVPTPFRVGPVNIFIVMNGDKTMMVDAGPKTEEAWEELKDAFQQIGIRPKDIDVIVLTHHHPDHTGLINYFDKDVPLYGHWRLNPWLSCDPQFMERHKEYFRNLSVLMGVPKEYLDKMPSLDGYLKYGGSGQVHTTLDEGDRIPGFEEWQVVYTPGHAFSHISLLQDDGLFIAGDVLLENISSNAILEPSYNDSVDAPHTLLQYRESLRKCLSLPIKRVLPGHGGVYDFKDSLVNSKLQAQEERRNEIYQLIKEGKSTTLEIGMTMFKGVWKHQLDLVLSEVQGHLDWLNTDGLVTFKIINGVRVYRAK